MIMLKSVMRMQWKIDLENEINKKMEINKNREKMHNKLF